MKIFKVPPSGSGPWTKKVPKIGQKPVFGPYHVYNFTYHVSICPSNQSSYQCLSPGIQFFLVPPSRSGPQTQIYQKHDKIECLPTFACIALSKSHWSWTKGSTPPWEIHVTPKNGWLMWKNCDKSMHDKGAMRATSYMAKISIWTKGSLCWMLQVTQSAIRLPLGRLWRLYIWLRCYEG